MGKMINRYMKNFQEILSASRKALNEHNDKNIQIDKIVLALELTESYLGRKLNRGEITSFTDIILEADEIISKKKNDSTVFKKGKYTIEIMTSEGKLIRTATSQKGILDVIHGERNYRVLDGNNRDITAKLKTFIKQKQKQEQLKKKYAKKKKMTNENFSRLNEGGAGSALADLLGKAADELIDPAGKAAGKAASRTAAELGGTATSKAARQAVGDIDDLLAAASAAPRQIDTAPITPAKQTLQPQLQPQKVYGVFDSATVRPFAEPEVRVPFRLDLPSRDVEIPFRADDVDLPKTPEVDVPSRMKTVTGSLPLARSSAAKSSVEPESRAETGKKTDTDSGTSGKPKDSTDPTSSPKTDPEGSARVGSDIATAIKSSISDDFDETSTVSSARTSIAPPAILDVETEIEKPVNIFKKRKLGIYGLPTNY